MSLRGRIRATVIAFDAEVGRGLVRAEDGIDYGFHALDVADGSRHVDLDVEVTARLAPRLGRWEVTDIEPVSR